MVSALPVRLAGRLGRELAQAAGLPGDARRWLAILRTRRAHGDPPHVSYGVERLPAPGEAVTGGIVKFQRLAAVFPNEPRRFDVVYLGSSSIPPDLRPLLWLARRRGAAIVWNQNGVAYPGWAGPRWERLNRPRALALHAADHVFFQSEFCRASSDRFLGPPDAPSEILYNAVDTTLFSPGPGGGDRPLTLLLAGSQYHWYRVEVALRALAAVRRERPRARLLVTGSLWTVERGESEGDVRRLVRELGLDDGVELVGPYSQRDAPELMRRADVLLHTKYNDPCPNVVIEALACGLPVAYSASGGVPELVGDNAGIGVPAPLDFDRDHPPAPGELADAVLAVAESLPERAAAARARAVERFDLAPWVERHRQVFAELAR